MTAGTACLLALGSNLGNRLANIQAALRDLATDLVIERHSALYQSAPIGPAGQPPYLNAVVLGRAMREPLALLAAAKATEWHLGRRASPPWSARPIDIDLLWMEGVHVQTRALSLPHPLIEQRAFVLLPLADVAPNLPLRDGLPASAHAARIDSSGLVRLAGFDWPTLHTVLPAGVRPDYATG